MNSAGGKLVAGRLLSFDAAPNKDPGAMRHYPRGALAIDDGGRIVWRGHRSRLPARYRDLPVDDYGSAIVMPGFIDLHIHFPQYRMLAAPGEDLLDWLHRFTFAEEARFASPEYAGKAADAFVDQLAANGTTTAVAYCSVHEASVEALFEAAEKRGMSLYAGKTMMDRNAPSTVLDTAKEGAEASARLLERWHRRGRNRYAITVRFAVTSSDAQLAAAGELCAAYPDCVFQTHLSESPEEIELVKAQFPWAKDYTDVYDRYRLLRPRALFGHALHLSARERRRLAATESTAVHCPTSNTFLGSGLFSIDKFRTKQAPVKIGIATDIGGGTSYSMLHTLGEAHKVARMVGNRFSVREAFYMATRGNAENLGAEAEIGGLEPGRWADLVVLDPTATEILAARDEISESVDDSLFALMMLGDERAVRATYIAGKVQ